MRGFLLDYGACGIGDSGKVLFYCVKNNGIHPLNLKAGLSAAPGIAFPFVSGRFPNATASFLRTSFLKRRPKP